MDSIVWQLPVDADGCAMTGHVFYLMDGEISVEPMSSDDSEHCYSEHYIEQLKIRARAIYTPKTIRWPYSKAGKLAATCTAINVNWPLPTSLPR
jgi:hypothetical protein